MKYQPIFEAFKVFAKAAAFIATIMRFIILLCAWENPNPKAINAIKGITVSWMLMAGLYAFLYAFHLRMKEQKETPPPLRTLLAQEESARHLAPPGQPPSLPSLPTPPLPTPTEEEESARPLPPPGEGADGGVSGCIARQGGGRRRIIKDVRAWRP